MSRNVNIEDYVNLNIDDDDEMATSINNLQNNDIMKELLDNYNKLTSSEDKKIEEKNLNQQILEQQQLFELQKLKNNKIKKNEKHNIKSNKNIYTILKDTIFIMILFILFNSIYFDQIINTYIITTPDIIMSILKTILVGLIYTVIKYFIL